MFMKASCAAAVALVAVGANGGAAEPGWIPGDPRAAFSTPDGLLWEAPMADGARSFVVEKRDGAEGDVAFVTENGTAGIRIRKSNERGCIIVRPAATFGVVTGLAMRASADVSSGLSSPEYSLGFIRLWGRKERLDFCRRMDGLAFQSGGIKMNALTCAPADRPERKFEHFRADDETGTNLVCAIIVAGAPSESVWRNLRIERLDDVQRRWEREKARRAARDFSADRVSDEAFRKALSGQDHTARVVREGDAVSLEVDGAKVAPVMYKSRVKLVPWSLSDGKRMREAGVGIHVLMVRFGAAPRRTCAWTTNGFDAAMAARDVEKEMRVAPEALFVVSAVIDPYPEYVLQHPDEGWRTAWGRRVFGSWVQAEAAVKDGEAGPKGCWPWVSVHSERWREDVKTNFTAFVEELKRRGLSRRIIGFHLAGSHDAQFAAAYTDFSPASVRAFRRRLKAKYKTVEALSNAWKRPVASFEDVTAPNFGSSSHLDPADRERLDFVEHLKQGPFNALEDIARHVKRCFGKDVIAMRWCLGTFSGMYEGAYDIGSFLDSDAFDVLVSQPGYDRRTPAVALGSCMPCASYRNRGKLHLWEFDFRTYGVIEEWARTEATFCGESSSGDDATWCAVHRRAAGKTLADGMGYWYFDMAGGWYSPEGVRADIAALMKDVNRLPPRAGWRPSAALVIDEEGALLRNLPVKEGFHHVRLALGGQANVLAASGVPYDVWLMEDLLRDPQLAAGYRTLVFAEMLSVDARRQRLLKALQGEGRTLVFLGETGRLGGAEAATGFRPSYGQQAADHEIEPVGTTLPAECRSLAKAVFDRHDYGVTSGWRYEVLSAPRTSVESVAGAEVLARYVSDGLPALARIRRKDWTGVFVCDPGGLTSLLFNRLVGASGGFVASRPGLQVDTNGRFLSVHCLEPGCYEVRLPQGGSVRNVKTGRVELERADRITLDLAAGETRWYVVERGVIFSSDIQ